MVSAFATPGRTGARAGKYTTKAMRSRRSPSCWKVCISRGLLVSIDAMGCQRDIAAQIHQQGGDYLLAVKGNQPSLQKAVEGGGDRTG